MLGLVFNIQRYSIHDGPGIRTTVFMKGCPLRCIWCSNSEGIKGHPEIFFKSSKCAKCGRCLEVCPVGASTMDGGEVKINRELCINCGKCTESCFYGARELVGKYMTVEEVLKEVEKDRPFYQRSSGGVTMTGGEPLFQPEFTTYFLKLCKEHALHTAMETCGFAEWKIIERALQYTDLLYYDIKHIDPDKHKVLTGVSNELIIENIKKVSKTAIPTIIRIPVVPGYNGSEVNIKATAKFVRELGTIKEIELLPYHRLGMSKYKMLGLEYKLEHVQLPSWEQLQKLKKIIISYGLTAL